jgi:peptidoglycan/LPS O-acetylase OafA/YrhL
MRFRGFDGLRGWLAWGVVLHHVTFFTGLQQLTLLRGLTVIGSEAVDVFIILSGFVITHLVITKDESYRFYLARRLCRIYPIYFVALALGCITTILQFKTFLAAPAQTTFLNPQLFMVQRDFENLTRGGLFAQLALHISLLHGTVSNNVLVDSPFMFLAPAWSLSLEWQFYIVAPLIIRAALHRTTSIVMATIAVISYHFFVHGLFGQFMLPSFLPGAILYFAIGIVSRLILAPAKYRGSWIAVAIVCAGYAWGHTMSLLLPVLWAIFLCTSVSESLSTWQPKWAGRLFSVLFESRLAKTLGKASYSTYLIHVPMIQLSQYLAVRRLDLHGPAAIAFVLIWTFGVTHLISQISYRFIEKPSIAFGNKFQQALK